MTRTPQFRCFNSNANLLKLPYELLEQHDTAADPNVMTALKD